MRGIRPVRRELGGRSAADGGIGGSRGASFAAESSVWGALIGSGWGPSSDTGRGEAEAAHERTANGTTADRYSPLWLCLFRVCEDNPVQETGAGGGAMAGSQTVRDPLVTLLVRRCKGGLCVAVLGSALWLSASPLLVRVIGRLHPIGSWRRRSGTWHPRRTCVSRMPSFGMRWR